MLLSTSLEFRLHLLSVSPSINRFIYLSCGIFYLCRITLLNLYPINLQYIKVLALFSIGVENSVDPDQMASSGAS